MNEEELKEIWKTDRAAPTIDFSGLRKILSDWQDKLRRKIKIDVAMQFVSLGVVLLVVWFYPELFFFFWIGVIMAVWYIWEILRLYRQEKEHEDYDSVRQFLTRKILSIKGFIWRVRLIFYCFPLVTIPAAFYSFGHFNGASAVDRDLVVALGFTLAVGEIVSVVLTEIYLKIFYSAAINKLRDLLRELNSEE